MRTGARKPVPHTQHTARHATIVRTSEEVQEQLHVAWIGEEEARIPLPGRGPALRPPVCVPHSLIGVRNDVQQDLQDRLRDLVVRGVLAAQDADEQGDAPVPNLPLVAGRKLLHTGGARGPAG